MAKPRKLTPERAAQVRAYASLPAAERPTQAEIGRMFGVCQTAVSYHFHPEAHRRREKRRRMLGTPRWKRLARTAMKRDVLGTLTVLDLENLREGISEEITARLAAH